MPSYYETLMEERDTLSGAIEQTVTAAQDKGGLSDDDKTNIATMQKRVADIDGELTILATEQDSLRKANEFAARFMRQPRTPAETRAPERTSVGSAFVASEAWKGYEGGRTRPWEYDLSTAQAEFRAPLMTTDMPTTIGKSVVDIAQAQPQFALFGVIGMEQISTGSFEYVSYTMDNQAAIVPEGTQKPETTFTENIVPGTLDTYAHWTQVTRQALEDSARIRSLIDGKLTEGVQRKIHDGVVDALTAAALPTATYDSLLGAIRHGMAVVQTAGFIPNAVLLNPADWAELDIDVMHETIDGANRRQSFWGLTAVASVDQPAGTATVGDFKGGVTLFYRSGVGVYATDSHASTFTQNVYTILAERRAKPAVVQPACLCECSVTAAP